MFDRNKKFDPLVDAVKGVMQVSEADRKAIAQVNEKFGIQAKKELPHEYHADYDRAVAEAKSGSAPRSLTEGAKQLDELSDAIKKRYVNQASADIIRKSKAPVTDPDYDKKAAKIDSRLGYLGKTVKDLNSKRKFFKKAELKEGVGPWSNRPKGKGPSVIPKGKGKVGSPLGAEGSLKASKEFEDRLTQEKLKKQSAAASKVFNTYLTKKNWMKPLKEETLLTSIQEEIRSHLMQQYATIKNNDKLIEEFVAALSPEQLDIMGIDEQEITKDNFVPKPSPTDQQAAGAPNLTAQQPLAAAPGKVTAPSVPANAPGGTPSVRSMMPVPPAAPSAVVPPTIKPMTAPTVNAVKPATPAKPATTAKKPAK